MDGWSTFKVTIYEDSTPTAPLHNMECFTSEIHTYTLVIAGNPRGIQGLYILEFVPFEWEVDSSDDVMSH